MIQPAKKSKFDLHKTIWIRWGIVLLILFILLATVFIPRQLSPKAPGEPAAALPVFSLAGYRRLLILAPHCDDETLGSAGLIQVAERAGIEVRVVIATNGDGFFFATAQDFRKLYLGSADFIRMGEVRQQESLAALKILGVRPDQVTFLERPLDGAESIPFAVQPGYQKPLSCHI
jgi:hypothetical protein